MTDQPKNDQAELQQGLEVEPKPDNHKEPTPVSKEEIAALFSQPAVYINHFYAAAAINSIRLTFAEKDMEGDIKIPRFSCLLSLPGLQELHNLTGQILSQIVMQQAGQQPKAQPKVEKERLN